MNIEIYPDLFCGEYPCKRDEFGINFWGHDTGPLTIIKEIGDAVLIREGGHNWRFSFGSADYAHPRYYIGIWAIGNKHARMGDVMLTIYNIEYGKQDMKAAKELALTLLESLSDMMDRRV